MYHVVGAFHQHGFTGGACRQATMVQLYLLLDRPDHAEKVVKVWFQSHAGQPFNTVLHCAVES